MIIKSALVLIVSAIISGCSATSTVQETQYASQCVYPDAPEIEAPYWVCDVMPSDLAAGAVGYAKKSAAGHSIMRKVAINDARVQLASQFQTEISNMYKQAIQSSTQTNTIDGAIENVIETFENATKTVVSRSLANSKILASQVSPSGGLYVLVGMDEKTFQANIDKVIDSANKDSTLWNKFNNEKAANELSNILNSLKSS